MEAWVALAPYIIEVQEADSDRGRSQMTSAESGREGGCPNSDAVREVA